MEHHTSTGHEWFLTEYLTNLELDYNNGENLPLHVNCSQDGTSNKLMYFADLFTET